VSSASKRPWIRANGSGVEQKINAQDGECQERNVRRNSCPSDFPDAIKFDDKSTWDTPTSGPCAMYTSSAAWHIQEMLKDHFEHGAANNNMYNRLASLDSLALQESDKGGHRPIWSENGFTIPGYTANVPPTYKLIYKTGVSQWNTFNTRLVEAAHMKSKDKSKRRLTHRALLAQAKLKTYALGDKLKKCEFDSGKDRPACVDFGWLDRLVYRDGAHARGNTIMYQYRTLEMLPGQSLGDHAPLFMVFSDSLSF